MSDDPFSTLPPNGLFADLAIDVRRRLAAFGQVQALTVGTYLVSQGEAHQELSVILSGQFSVTVHAHGDIVKLAEIGAGHTVGEMNLIDPAKASADVVVIEAATVWTISIQAFEAFVDQDPKAGYAVLKVLGRELCRRLRHNSETMLKQLEANRTHFVDNDY